MTRFHLDDSEAISKSRVALDVVSSFECSRHGHDAGRAAARSLLPKADSKTRRRNALRTEQRVAFFRDVWNGRISAVTETDEPLAQTRFGFVVRERARPGVRQAGGAEIYRGPYKCARFLRSINFAFDLRRARRAGCIPMQRGACLRAAVLIDSNGGEAERAETGFHFLSGTSAPMTRRISARVNDYFGGALPGKYQQRQRANSPPASLQNQFGRHGARQARGISGWPRGRSAWMLQCATSENSAARPNGDPVRTGALDQKHFVENRNFRFGAAHDSPMPTAREPSASLSCRCFDELLDSVEGADLSGALTGGVAGLWRGGRQFCGREICS